MSENDSKEELQELYMIEEEAVSTKSTIEPPMSEWSSLEEAVYLANPKMVLASQGLYAPGSGEICTKYIAMSDSDISRHLFYQYPPLTDPGIKASLLAPEKPIIYSDDGQEYYLELCKEMNQAPIRIFYKNLTSPRINLSYYGVNPEHVRAMAMALQHNKIVHYLNLTDSFLSYDACYHLGRMLYSNTTLSELVLAGCRIGPKGLNNLANGLQVNRSLIKLDLSGNVLDDDGGTVFAQALFAGTVVPQVNLSRNSFGMKTANSLNEALSITNKMTHINLSWNCFFHQPSTARLIERLAESNVLQEVDLSWNTLEGEKVAIAISNLIRVPTLVFLDLSNNRFHEEEIIEILVSNLWRAKKLHTFDLSSNPLSPSDALIVIKTFLKPRVKVQKLLMDNIWVDRKFLNCLDRVKAMKTRKDFVVIYGGVLHNWVAKGPDPREIILLRADYVGKSDKKHRVDVGLYFLGLNKELGRPISVKDLIDRADADGVRLSEELLNEFAVIFPGPKKSKSKHGSVDLRLMAEYIQRLWPERRLPPTPPPEPEPEPITVPEIELISEPKKKKAKK